MNEWLINVTDLPAEGRDFSFADQEFWDANMNKHGLQAGTQTPFEAQVHVSPQSEGALVRGTLRGSLRLSCDRCTATYALPVDVSFDLFETPAEADEPAEDSRIRLVDGALMLDMGALVWEELMLALPVKPLCDEACAGICPSCGVDLNDGDCDCERDEGDPRLAVFRNLKLK